MSHEVAATRRVDVRHFADSTQVDQWGNEIPGAMTVVTYSTTREQLTSEQDVINREFQAKTFRYMFPAKATIVGTDILYDHFDGKLLDIVGDPNAVRNGIGVLHHWEVLAKFTEG